MIINHSWNCSLSHNQLYQDTTQGRQQLAQQCYTALTSRQNLRNGMFDAVWYWSIHITGTNASTAITQRTICRFLSRRGDTLHKYN